MDPTHMLSSALSASPSSLLSSERSRGVSLRAYKEAHAAEINPFTEATEQDLQPSSDGT
jgi:hypothetical protein